jgi:hypothetical protein
VDLGGLVRIGCAVVRDGLRSCRLTLGFPCFWDSETDACEMEAEATRSSDTVNKIFMIGFGFEKNSGLTKQVLNYFTPQTSGPTLFK